MNDFRLCKSRNPWSPVFNRLLISTAVILQSIAEFLPLQDWNHKRNNFYSSCTNIWLNLRLGMSSNYIQLPSELHSTSHMFKDWLQQKHSFNADAPGTTFRYSQNTLTAVAAEKSCTRVDRKLWPKCHQRPFQNTESSKVLRSFTFLLTTLTLFSLSLTSQQTETEKQTLIIKEVGSTSRENNDFLKKEKEACGIPILLMRL